MNSDILTAFARVAKEPTDMIEHMETIRTYSAQCRIAVEFGVYDCTSTWALMAGLPERLTSYDIARRPEVDEVEAAALGSSTAFAFVLADSTAIEIEPADLLFVDSMHTYAHLTHELALHAGKIRRFILLHDTTTFGYVDQDGQGNGLWPAIAEFVAASPAWFVREKFNNCHGLTVLERR